MGSTNDVNPATGRRVPRVRKPTVKAAPRRTPSTSHTGRNDTGIKNQERLRRALSLRQMGLPYATIAEQLGYYDASSAYRAVQRALEHVRQDDATAHVIIEEERLTALLSVQMAKALAGDARATELVLSLSRRIDELKGVGQSASQVNVQQGVIIVGGTEHEYTKALEEATQRQQALTTGDDDVIEAEIVDEEWDAWEARDSA